MDETVSAGSNFDPVDDSDVNSNNMIMLLSRRWLETASELYDQVEFKTDALFNQPAPEYWVSFIIGGVFSLFGFLLWLWRVYQTKRQLDELKIPLKGTTLVRAMISRAIDNDENIWIGMD